MFGLQLDLISFLTTLMKNFNGLDCFQLTKLTRKYMLFIALDFQTNLILTLEDSSILFEIVQINKNVGLEFNYVNQKMSQLLISQQLSIHLGL